MSIVLRNLKGSALTYTEMDRNQSQFFYSASLADGGGTLKLYYTGSSLLNDVDGTSYAPRSVDISIGGGGATGVTQLVAGSNITLTNSAGQPSSGTGVVTINATGGGGGGTPGTPVTSIQFNDEGSFGGDASFVYDKANDFVGVGITSGMQRRLHINDNILGGAIIRLQANDGNGPRKEAFLEIGNRFNSTLTQIGKVNPNSLHTYIHQIQGAQRTHFSFDSISSITATVSKVGIGIGIDPNRDLSILSDSSKGIGIGGGSSRGVENRIRILPDAVWQKTFVDNSGIPLDGINRYGLGIQTPIQGSSEGGNMLIAISDDTEGRSEIRDPNRLLITAYDVDRTDDSLEEAPIHIAAFTSAGRVGINTPDPNQDIRLDINGQYRGAYTAIDSVNNVDFKNYSVVKATLTTISAATPFFNIPPAGTKGVLVVTTDTNCTLNFVASPGVISTGNPEVVKATYATFTFVSDGTNLIETSRTVDMT